MKITKMIASTALTTSSVLEDISVFSVDFFNKNDRDLIGDLLIQWFDENELQCCYKKSEYDFDELGSDEEKTGKKIMRYSIEFDLQDFDSYREVKRCLEGLETNVVT